MKRVYFVRHGQTLNNVRHIHQGPDEPLTDNGAEQAREVAALLKSKNIDTLVSSPFVRAYETAVIIGKELDLPIRETDSVKELRRPDPLYGKPHYSLASLSYVLKMFWHQSAPNWDDHGAENMFAIRNRIIDAKRFIAQVEGERVAVVSHAVFIDLFVQAVCANRSLTIVEYVRALLGAKRLKNAGIVAFDLDPNAPPETCNWWLVNEETDRDYLKYR